MRAIHFVDALINTGRVTVDPEARGLEGVKQATEVLFSIARVELASTSPALCEGVAEWALVLLYRGCQALVYRELDAQDVRHALAEPCPRPPSPDVCFSADLAFRFLPDLISLARGIAENDPLVVGLRAVAARWPLSSVGVTGLPEVDGPAPFIEHPGLRRLYVDRIIERNDVSRLTDRRARAAVLEAIGGMPELATPSLIAALRSTTPA